MGEEPDRLAERPGDPSEQDLRKLEREIAASRERLTDLVAELDRRRHDLLSLRERPLRAAAVAAGTAAVAAVVTVVVLRVRSRRRAMRTRAGRLGEAFSRMIAHPERVASNSKTPLLRIAVAVLPIVVKKIADRALRKSR